MGSFPPSTQRSTAIKGWVKAVKFGDIEAEVTLELSPGVELTATITRASAERLGLTRGQVAHAVIKASDVMIAVEGA